MRIWNKVIVVNLSATALFTGLLIGSAPLNEARADAGGKCHFHGKKEATEETIIRCAEYHRGRLSKKGSIETTWNALAHESIEKVVGPKGKQEWRVVFTQPTPTDEAKKKLYMFFALNGNFLAANHTGK